MPKPRNNLTAKYVRSIFDYDAKKGELIWKTTISKNRNSRGGNSRPNRTAGFTGSNGYKYVYINGSYYLVHRIIYLHKTGKWPPCKIDHFTGDALDNKKIRPATHSQNVWNQKKSVRNTSGFKGVSFFKPTKQWRAQISASRKHHHLGLFATAEEAHAAYCKAAKKLHGKFANFG